MKFLNKEISGTFATVSGIWTTKPDTIELASGIPEIGVITSKSIGIKEWDIPSSNYEKGPSLEPIICEINKGCLRNNVNLRNVGYKRFREEIEEVYHNFPNDKFFLCSIFDREKENLAIIAKSLEDVVDCFELNFSCPHAAEGIGAIGSNKQETSEYTKAVRNATKKPIIVKLTPNVDNIGEIALAAMRAGADGISAINTYKADIYYHNTYPVLSRKIGGESGRNIKDIGVKSVREITKKIGRDVPMIVMGGITTAEDIIEYRKAGGNTVIIGLGTVFMGMTTEKRKKYLPALIYDIKHGTNTADQFVVKDLIMQYNEFKIKDIKKVDDDLRIFYFDKDFSCLPGQYVFTWIPGIGEKPFSVADNFPLTLAARNVGRFTSALFDKNKNDVVYIRGPYGQGIEPLNGSYIVAGGTGAAVALMLARSCNHPKIFLGATSEKQVLFEEEFKMEGTLIKGIDNGEKGEILRMLYLLLNEEIDKNAAFYNIGPSIFMKKAMKIESEYTTLNKIFSSLEIETNCGIGLCGQCSINGYLSCVDGPFFNAEFLMDSKQFQ